MKPTEAAKLLGGYATGTLSEAERQALFAAALDRQELFDALMDEEGKILDLDSDNDDEDEETPSEADLVAELREFLDTIRPEDFGQ